LESDAEVTVVGLVPDGSIQSRAAVGGTSLRFRERDEWAETRRLKPAQLEMPE
jgi:hypothetical protein